jgi:hypothetical protein
MKRTFPELPGWSFEVRERSAGVYEVVGVDASGRRVETVGTDDTALLKECRAMVAKVSSANAKIRS